jgi:hypothetical protein
LRYVPNEVVTFRDGKYLTLGEVFESLKLTGERRQETAAGDYLAHYRLVQYSMHITTRIV